jgi:muramoyltetrapeptide carboxypeptidase LdcA involved in peptidoglycan recycling
MEYQVIKPAQLRPGDTIGIISPSWGGPGAYPHRLHAGMQQMEAMGFQVMVAPHARNQCGFVSDTAENRANDIHMLFSDPEVKAIVSSIGGDHSCHLLPLLDFDLIQRNPKIFMGYSDITVLNVAIFTKTGLVTFNGPAVMTDFAEQPRMFTYTENRLRQIVCQPNPPGAIDPAEEWTEELLDWSEKKDLERPRWMTPSPGWTWLKEGQAEGRLLGGCIESLQHLRGTPYWPDWSQAILFFETSEEKPSPSTVDGILMDYENMGVLQQISGMLVGRPMSYEEKEKQTLRDILLDRTREYHFPMVTDMDFGHTAPQMTLPIGCRARIDSINRRFEIIETAVSE